MTARLLLALVLAPLAGCTAPEAPPGVPAAAGAPSAPTLGTSVVTSDQLRALLPDAVGGVSRSRLVAEQDSAMGLTVSRASATYGAEADSVTVLVFDVGSAEGARLMGIGGPTTETLDGRPVTRSATATRASVQALVGGRYVVEASGRGVPPERLDAALRSVDLSALPGGA